MLLRQFVRELQEQQQQCVLQVWRQYVHDYRQGTLDGTMSAEFRSSCVGFVNVFGAYRYSADTGAPRSLCMRILYADILHNLERDDDALLQLASIPPPFDSWTSSPASEDDWLDPADEMSVGPGDLCDWEEQVSCWVCSTLSLSLARKHRLWCYDLTNAHVL